MQYFVDMTLSLAITTGQRMLGNSEIGNEAGKCRSDSIPRMTYPFLRRRSGSVSVTKLCPSNTLHEVQFV